jgi:hypothetical protein
MNRRTWFRSLAFALSSLPVASCLLADSLRAEGSGVASLRDTLRSGLRCRRPEEFAFVDLVVDKVDDKKIPESMVLSMFNYARDRRPKLPFPYFEVGMRKRAAAIGVDL